MKRTFIIGLIAVLAVATIVYAQTVNKQIYGVATPGLYKYTLSTNTMDPYLLAVPTLTVADTMVGLAAIQKLTNKELEAPTITSPTITGSPTIWGLSSFAVGDIPYASASTTLSKLAAVATGQTLESAGVTTAPIYKDKNIFSYSALAMVPNSLVTFSTTQARVLIWKLTSTSGTAVPVITAPNVSGQMYLIQNSTGQTVTVKKSGGSGAAITSGKRAFVYHDGSDYVQWQID